MADREETLVAASEPELRAALRALGRSVQPVDRPRRTRTGDWYVHVRAAPQRVVTPPPQTGARPPWVLLAVAGVGAAAVAVLLVLATAWTVRHWQELLGAALVAAMLAALAAKARG